MLGLKGRIAGPSAAVIAVAALAAVPLVVTGPSERSIATIAVLYGLLVVSWNLTLGFAGIYNFGHVALFGVGGYATAISTIRWEISPWLALAFGGAAGLVASLVVFLPVVRLRGIYAALVTFVFVQVCFSIAVSQRGLTGGATGLVGIDNLALGDYSFLEDGKLGYYFVGAALLVAAILVGEIIERLPLGRSIIALRDHEEYAVSRGVPAVRQRILIFMISGFIAGLAGGLYVQYIGVATTDLFSLSLITLLLSMMLLGGIGRHWGPAIGAVAITILNNKLQYSGVWRVIVTSTIILLVLAFFPRGVAGLLEDLSAWVARMRSRSTPPPSGPQQDARTVLEATHGP